MRTVWLGLAALAISACGGTLSDGHHHPPPQPVKASRCKPPRQRVVDLTHRLHDATPVWPGERAFSMTRVTDYDAGFRAHDLAMGEGVGTHLDAPAHVVEGTRSLHEIPVEELVAPAVVIDVRAKAATDPDYVINGDDIVDWEAIHGPVPVACVVIFNTGWHERFNDPPAYLGTDDEGGMHFPGLSAEAAQALVERDVIAVGIDTPSLDPGRATSLEAHRVILGANKYQIENLANLGALPEIGATLIVAALPILDGTQAPARVIALVPEAEAEVAP